MVRTLLPSISMHQHKRKLPSHKIDPGMNFFNPMSGDFYTVRVRLSDTNEVFVIPNCHLGTQIGEFKGVVELEAGIPEEFQRLSYLDEADLVENSTFNCNDIVPWSIITLKIWPYNGWPELVKAAATGDIIALTSSVLRAPPISQRRALPTPLELYRSHRFFSALFICSHRGHEHAVRFLIDNDYGLNLFYLLGADVKAQTTSGRSALHVAALMRQTRCVEQLLTAGAQAQQRDGKDFCPLSLAKQRGKDNMYRLLHTHHWHQRTVGMKAKMHLQEWELFPHQHFDSHLKTWYRGQYAQHYSAVLKDKRLTSGMGGSGGKVETERGGKRRLRPEKAKRLPDGRRTATTT